MLLEVPHLYGLMPRTEQVLWVFDRLESSNIGALSLSDAARRISAALKDIKFPSGEIAAAKKYNFAGREISFQVNIKYI